ncbi:MAG: hypothetical protein FJZ11_06810 [Candidatus Omnitrophica bacterium]|nr:hypothetical protein [Candidatus Omnitrophota bacterium]
MFDIAKNSPSLIKKSILLGIFFSLFIAPNYINVGSHRKTYFNEDKKAISILMRYCGNNTCLVLIPYHPVFNHDVTRLYSSWQSIFISRFPSVKKDAESKNITEAILHSKPAVISYSFKGRTILLDLFLKELISKDDVNKLRPFLNENYTVKRIGEARYYIRNDRL